MTEKTEDTPAFTIDAIGLLCPMPVLKLGKLAATSSVGTVIELMATDPMAPIDSEHFCNQKGFEFLGCQEIKQNARDVFSIKIKI